MTNPLDDRNTVTLSLASDDTPFFQTPLNLSSQRVSPVTLMISHYLHTIHIVVPLELDSV